MRKIYRNLVLWVCCTLLGTMFSNGQSVTINTTDYKQTISMMGGDMERSSFAVQNASNPQEIIDWGFKDINFNTCRVQYDKNQELIEGTKNWAFYAKQVTSMKMVKTSNPSIKFFATLRSDYDGYNDLNNLPDWICNYTTKAVNASKYGIFLADYIQYMSQQGIAITYLSVAKEWSSFITADVAKNVINKLNSELTARGVAKPLIVDQGFWSISGGNTYLNRVNTLGTSGLYYAFCSHDYANEGNTLWSSFVTKANNMGKNAWNDETSAGAGGPTSGAEPDISVPIDAYVQKCIAYQAGLQGEIFFELWSRGINKETRSIYFTSGQPGTRLRGYYIMKLFANKVKNNKYITSSIAGLPGVYTMTFRNGNNITLWVINTSTTTYSATSVNIGGATITANVSKTFWTNSTPITGSSASPTWQPSKFWASFDAQSLCCFTFTVADIKSEEITANSTVVNATNLCIVPNIIANGQLNVKMDGIAANAEVIINLVSMDGKNVKGLKGYGGNITLNVSGLKSGIYLAIIKAGNNVVKEKIFIQ